MYIITHKQVHTSNFKHKTFIFSAKDAMILVFLVEYYTSNMDIIRYY